MLIAIMGWYILVLTFVHLTFTVKHLYTMPLFVVSGWMVLCGLQWLLLLVILKRRFRRATDKRCIC